MFAYPHQRTMKVVCIGEVMAEVRCSDGRFEVGFAGDTFNTAIYCRRRLAAAHLMAVEVIGHPGAIVPTTRREAAPQLSSRHSETIRR